MSSPTAVDPHAGHRLDRPALLATLAGFAVLTVVALVSDGVGGFVDAITFSWASAQIYVDLVIAVVVLCVWMYRDARAHGRNPWPFIVASLVVGMFGPLAYLLTRRTAH